jgi:RNA polymerase sigma-70 factor (ECF subfamily)
MSEAAGAVERSLADARAGSPAALGSALNACRGYLLLVAQGEMAEDLRAKGGASDLVQETLMEAYRDFAGFQGESEAELLAWLRRLLLNNLADFTRQYRGTGKRRLDREVAPPANDSSAAAAGSPAAAGPTPSGAAAAGEQAAAVRLVLDRLPPDYRRVIELRYQEGRPFEEIGQELGLTANAARKLLLRAVERVQQELGEPP